jgi:phage tail sheath protein FI
MPEYLSPAVYVEEVSGGIRPIEGVGTATGAFIGVAERGPVVGAQYEDGVGRPVLVTSFGDFVRTFGGFINGEFLAYAVQQFFGEGGTRCFVARTAHFGNPADRTTLTARRASIALPGGVSTTLAAELTAAGTQMQLASTAGVQEGMDLLITAPGQAPVRVRAGAVAGNNVTVPGTGRTAAIPTGAVVRQAILEVNALNEGEWGNNLRVALTVSGRLTTTLAADLAAGATQATLTDVTGVQPGMTLFIMSAAGAARVQVTRVDRGTRVVTFRTILPISGTTPAVPAIASGSAVSTTILGKASTVLDGAAPSGATEAVLGSVQGIEVGSILLFVNENMGNLPATPPSQTTDRVRVTRVVGRRVIFEPALGAAYPDRTPVTTEDFTLAVFDGDDQVETHANLSMENTNQTDYVESRINASATRSRYIRVREPALRTGNLLPGAVPVALRLVGGTNGDPDSDTDYTGNQATQTGFFGFDSVDDINILAAPGITLRPVLLAGMSYCQNRADCFFVGELPRGTETVSDALDFKNGTGAFAGQQALNSTYGALYWPWVRILDPLTGRPLDMPPSGAVIGTYAATDSRRGVHKAPAGVEDGFLNTVIGIVQVVTRGEHDLLNPQGINVIRVLPNIGIVIFGARTTSSDPEWRYVNVRRLFLFLEESIQRGTQWVVFEPNDPVLWKRIVRNISAFLRVQWQEGKLVGDKPEQAFFVKCDEETNPPESVDLGRVITLIGVAPSKPAEFVIFRIMQARPGAD